MELSQRTIIAALTVALAMAGRSGGSGNGNVGMSNRSPTISGSYTVVVEAISASPIPFREVQPNGRSIVLQLVGDEEDAYLVDLDGYTVLHDNATKEYRYAQHNGTTGDLECSTVSVGDDAVVILDLSDGVENTRDDDNEEEEEDYDEDRPHQYLQFGGGGDDAMNATALSPPPSSPTPTSATSNNEIIPPKTVVQLQKGIRPTRPKDCTDNWCDDSNDSDGLHRMLLQQNQKQQQHGSSSSSMPKDNSGRSLRGSSSSSAILDEESKPRSVLRNLVIPLLWSDHTDRALPTVEQLNVLMNHDGPHTLCPNGSIRDFFLQNSYGRLSIDSYVVDWIPMKFSESYYADGNRGLSRHFHKAIVDALNYLDDNQLVNFDEFDLDNDSKIDAITFLHSGYAAEFGGTDMYGTHYTDRIWSHKWMISPRFSSSRSGVVVGDYHVASAFWGTSGSAIARIGVIAHETGHFLGLPDLYDINGGGNGIGSYGAMGNAWGFDGSQNFPPHLSAWSKLQLGWLDSVEPTEGRNLVEASEIQSPTLPQVYKITRDFPDGEYLLIENRQPLGFDGRMPQGGLVIWHIDEKAGLHQEGSPSQPSWPQNGNHYRVAVLPADGEYHLEQMQNRGDRHDVFHAQGVSNELRGCRTHPSCQHPNTNSYQNGQIVPTGISISMISNSDIIMSFYFSSSSSMDEDDNLSVQPSPSPTMAPSLSPTYSPLSVMLDVSKADPQDYDDMDKNRPNEEGNEEEQSFVFHVTVEGGVPPYAFAWSFGDGSLMFGPEDTRIHSFPIPNPKQSSSDSKSLGEGHEGRTETTSSYTIRVVALDGNGDT
eukprot:CAMPEP_0113493578 /NCGR_PEP_ID=MMETSP0014_2-20120614/28663_1 /TAXON_ID=2857 /ORGANISM="Nitzschia sp." /LENGTH=820 /DNA_ID=CAMNT_0000387443 /DNA_START=589 /DNA_END=3048 /DNA_ORIENTATION=+ /assembly_acc=CAM_ASM_000159